MPPVMVAVPADRTSSTSTTFACTTEVTSVPPVAPLVNVNGVPGTIAVTRITAPKLIASTAESVFSLMAKYSASVVALEAASASVSHAEKRDAVVVVVDAAIRIFDDDVELIVESSGLDHPRHVAGRQSQPLVLHTVRHGRSQVGRTEDVQLPADLIEPERAHGQRVSRNEVLDALDIAAARHMAVLADPQRARCSDDTRTAPVDSEFEICDLYARQSCILINLKALVFEQTPGFEDTS